MYRNPPAGTNPAPVQYAQGGYEASFGTYEIDERQLHLSRSGRNRANAHRQRFAAAVRVFGPAADRQIV
jgi:hypothetical protein